MKLPPEMEERFHHGKKAIKTKPYAIEIRHWGRGKQKWRDWYIWSRYATREQRDQALPKLARKYARLEWQFRARDPEGE